MLAEAVFNTLRTQGQLGYSSKITLGNTYGVMERSVTVNTQATKCTAEHVEQRIENFIADHLTEEEVGDW